MPLPPPIEGPINGFTSPLNNAACMFHLLHPVQLSSPSCR